MLEKDIKIELRSIQKGTLLYQDFRGTNYNTHGTISRDIQAGVTVNIFPFDCSGYVDVIKAITNSEGYFSLGGLGDGRYLVVPDNYVFSVQRYWVGIPQAPIKAYDFTRIE